MSAVPGLLGVPTAVLALLGVAFAVAGCSSEPARGEADPVAAGATTPATSPTAPRSRQPTPTSPPSGAAGTPATPSEPVGPVPSDGRPRRATLTVPALGLRDLPVVPYEGWTDDGPGTRIQNGGVAASPHGPRGGVGPGGVGNYQVTAHRTSSTAAFADLPSLRRGDRALVEVAGTTYVYEIRNTRETSFRSRRSLAEQRAAVPGRPGAAPQRAYLTLSTCATPEDHAAGNYWSDRFHNPEHRIDKIGVLVRVRSAQS
jgi:sortase A